MEITKSLQGHYKTMTVTMNQVTGEFIRAENRLREAEEKFQFADTLSLI